MKYLFLIMPVWLANPVFSQNITLVNNQINLDQCADITVDTSLYLNVSTDITKLTDDYKITTVVLEEDCLIIEVVFGGGCGNSNFILETDGLITECMYPEVVLLLVLQNDDLCKALIHQKLRFDVSSYKMWNPRGMKFRILNSDFVIDCWSEW